MSSLSAASSFDDILDSYLTNASYEEDSSTSKAAAFVTACRMLLLMPKRAGTGSRATVEMDVEQIKSELKAARDWIAANPSSEATLSRGGSRNFSFENFYE
jgi:hypothetical protein